MSNNKDAYKTLNNLNLQWGRKDVNHIYVWTPGYITQDAHNIEKYLIQFGMRLVSQDFDNICGKTKTVFKHN